MKILLLTEKDVQQLLSIDEIMEVVESAFREKDLGHVEAREDYREVKDHISDSKF